MKSQLLNHSFLLLFSKQIYSKLIKMKVIITVHATKISFKNEMKLFLHISEKDDMIYLYSDWKWRKNSK